jgi:nucleoside-diphosphate-sugar epimerase
LTFAGRNVLVTGGAGVIGSRLVRSLLEAQANVVVVDDLSAPALGPLQHVELGRFVRGDVTDDDCLEEAFAGGVDSVWHLAGLFANQKAIEQPAEDLRVNGAGTLSVLRAAARAGVRRFVYASSSCVYGAATEMPLCEESVSLAARSPYHATKVLGELYANYFRASYGLSTVTVRLFNVFGPGELPGPHRNVIPNFIWCALRDAPLVILGDGTETRDFTYVDDAVRALVQAGLHDKAVGMTLNVGTGRETPLQRVAELILEKTGSSAPIEYDARRSWDRVLRRRADLTRAERVLGYRPRWSLERGLDDTIGWFRARADAIASAVEQPVVEYG